MEICRSGKQGSCNLSYLLKSGCALSPCLCLQSCIPSPLLDGRHPNLTILNDINANFMFVRSEVSLSTDTSLAFHLQNDANVFSMLSRAIPLSNTSLSEHIFRRTLIYIVKQHKLNEGKS